MTRKSEIKVVYDQCSEEFRNLTKIEWTADDSCGPLAGHELSGGVVVEIVATREMAVLFDETLDGTRRSPRVIIRCADRASLTDLARLQESDYAARRTARAAREADRLRRIESLQAEALVIGLENLRQLYSHREIGSTRRITTETGIQEYWTCVYHLDSVRWDPYEDRSVPCVDYLYRRATQDEIQSVSSEYDKADAKVSANKRLAEIAAEIKECGERPKPVSEKFSIQEKPIYHGNNDGLAYGVGQWFHITTTHIWSCIDNGSDGDDWSRNNVRTGGAGAIGYRIPLDDGLAAEIQRLAAALAN